MDPTSAIPIWGDVAARIAAGWERLPVTLDLDGEEPFVPDQGGTLTTRAA